MSLAQERLRSWRFPSDWIQMNVDFREKSHLRGLFFFESPREPRKNEMPSAVDWAASPVAALLIWLDLVTCTTQIDPEKCKNISSWFTVLLNEQGFSGFFKFGFYEFFKKLYAELAGPEHASKYKTFIYLVGSASAEIIANVALFPMEAMKIRIQTQPGFAKGLRDGLPKFVASEGLAGLHKGLVPIWGRQIPYKHT